MVACRNLTDHRSAKTLEKFELAPGLIGNLMTGADGRQDSVKASRGTSVAD